MVPLERPTAMPGRVPQNMTITKPHFLVVLLAVMITAMPTGGSVAADDDAIAAKENGDSSESAMIASEKKIAGRTIADCRRNLESDNRVKRLRAIRTLGAFDDAAGKSLRLALGHDDPAVRFLAATHLGRIGGESLAQSVDTLKKLVSEGNRPRNGTSRADRDATPQPLAVRLAAAYALCESGRTDQYLTILTAAVSFPDRGTACSAADLIGRLGPDADAASATLEAAYAENKPGVKGGDYHVGGAAMNALRKIRNE